MIQGHLELSGQRIAELGRQVLEGHTLTREEARELARVCGDDLYDLFYWANKIRLRFVGPNVRFCSIVAGRVGACSEDCAYCSQSRSYDTHVKPAKLKVVEIEQAAQQALENGAQAFGVVNSGRGPSDRDLDWLEPFFKQLSSQGKIRTCATLGELTLEQAQRLWAAGVVHINHNLETSRRNFPNLISTHSYEDRVRTLRIAKSVGMSVCAGGIFGMGEDWEDRIDMALDLRELEAESIPINFLNAIPGTPLYGRWPQLAPMEALQIVAVYRFLLPTRELKIAGGREKILRDMQSWMFFAGGSSFLIGNYLTTIGRSPEQDHQLLRDLGIAYETFDEVEHEAQPAEAGRALSLPVVS